MSNPKAAKRARPRTNTRDSVSWKLIDERHSENGVLCAVDIQEIAIAHELDANRLQLVSRKQLGVFRRDLSVGLKAETMRALAADRQTVGAKKVRRANDLLRMALSKLTDAQKQLENVQFSAPYSFLGRDNPLDARLAEFEVLVASLEDFTNFLSAMERAKLSRAKGTPDARKVSDVRRNFLCIDLFNLWLEHGRSLTFTTDPLTSERTGKLIDFVNDVVMRLTDPPQKLSGEAIRRELQDFIGEKG
jgi:hypothetical protein